MSKKLKWNGRGSIKSAMKSDLTLIYLAAAVAFYLSAPVFAQDEQIQAPSHPARPGCRTSQKYPFFTTPYHPFWGMCRPSDGIKLKLVVLYKKSTMPLNCHYCESRNPIISSHYGFPLPDQVEDRFRGNDSIFDFLRFHQD
jgi:hypothetical protein